MPLKSIKKNQMPQIDPRTIPGYNPPPEIASPLGAPPPGPPPKRPSVSQILSQPQKAAQEMGYDLQPVRPRPAQARRVWVSRHFKTAESDDIGAWLTEIENSTGVLGMASAYAPGGVVVIAQTREARERP